EAQPQLPVAPRPERRAAVEAADLLERVAPDHGARGGDRVRLEQRTAQRDRRVKPGRGLAPELAGGRAVRPDDLRAPEADRGLRVGAQCFELGGALALRGWGRYTARLVDALRARNGSDGLDYAFLAGDAPGPELVWEQLALPRELRRLGADVVHAPNCFLPLRRPCPGAVTIHDL